MVLNESQTMALLDIVADYLRRSDRAEVFHDVVHQVDTTPEDLLKALMDRRDDPTVRLLLGATAGEVIADLQARLSAARDCRDAAQRKATRQTELNRQLALKVCKQEHLLDILEQRTPTNQAVAVKLKGLQEAVSTLLQFPVHSGQGPNVTEAEGRRVVQAAVDYLAAVNQARTV